MARKTTSKARASASKAKTETVAEPQSPSIDINDLIVIRQVIDASTKAGVFTAENLTIVGKVYDKVNRVVNDFLEKQEKEAPAAEKQDDEAVWYIV